MNTRSHVPRAFDGQGRLQMAEGRIDGHGPRATPLDNLFVIHHYDAPEPAWNEVVEVTGATGAVRRLTLADIQSMPARTETVLLECAGNARGLLPDRAPGTQFGLGLFGQVTWTGTSLATVLRECGLADQTWSSLVVDAADAGVAKPEGLFSQFAKGLPRSKALAEETMLAWAVEGRPVPAEHGGPLRLIVPGWYGIWWVKWVRRMAVSQETFRGFWQCQRYTYQEPDGAIGDPVTEQLLRAMVTTPADGAAVADETAVRGLAWAGERVVERVEVTYDDGQQWQECRINGRTGRWGWVRWESTIPAGLPRGLRRVSVRVVDDSGRCQDWDSHPNRLGYGNNGIHTVTVDLAAAEPSR